MRTICMFSFVLSFGCVSHLLITSSLISNELPKGLDALSYLYQGGISGNTGGLLCGGLATVIYKLCGPIISYIFLLIVAFFTLLASVGITIPSIITAIQNRPRMDEAEKPEREEPAAIVVNHIAKKRIEYLKKRKAELDYDEFDEDEKDALLDAQPYLEKYFEK